MKKAIIILGLIAMSVVPVLGQERQSIKEFLAGYRKGEVIVRGTFAGVLDSKRFAFDLGEDGEAMTIELGGKPKEAYPEFFALDVRDGDTLTVVGVHKKRAKVEEKMVSAKVLSIDYAADHDEKTAYTFSLDEKPSFQGGGTKGFSQWVTSQLVYPEESRLAAHEGTAWLRFTIEKTGEMTNIEMIESTGDSLLDAEALRVVNSAPDWEPGKIKGKAVSTVWRLPVIFKLRDPSPFRKR